MTRLETLIAMRSKLAGLLMLADRLGDERADAIAHEYDRLQRRTDDAQARAAAKPSPRKRAAAAA